VSHRKCLTGPRHEVGKRSRASRWASVTAYLHSSTLSEFTVVTWVSIVDGPLCRVEFTESIVMYTELAARHER
jgi:hypothetical protein